MTLWKMTHHLASHYLLSIHYINLPFVYLNWLFSKRLLFLKKKLRLIGAEGARLRRELRDRWDHAGAWRRGGSPPAPRKASILERKSTTTIFLLNSKKVYENSLEKQVKNCTSTCRLFSFESKIDSIDKILFHPPIAKLGCSRL